MDVPAQVLVISPDRAVRQTAERCLSVLGHIAHLARGFDEARRAVDRARIDVVCLDSILPHDGAGRFAASLGNGATAALLLAIPSAPSATASLPPFFDPRRHGLVTKPIVSREFARQVGAALAERARRNRRDGFVQVGGIAFDAATRRLLFSDGGELPLTPTEARLVGCLLRRPGEFVSHDELLQEVWDYPPELGGPEVVRAHVSNLRRKLRFIGKDPQLLRTQPFQGYALVAGGAP